MHAPSLVTGYYLWVFILFVFNCETLLHAFPKEYAVVVEAEPEKVNASSCHRSALIANTGPNEIIVQLLIKLLFYGSLDGFVNAL